MKFFSADQTVVYPEYRYDVLFGLVISTFLLNANKSIFSDQFLIKVLLGIKLGSHAMSQPFPILVDGTLHVWVIECVPSPLNNHHH